LKEAFGLTQPLPRPVYAGWGLSLAALKYALDAALVYLVTGVWWDPRDYVNPMLSHRLPTVAIDSWLSVVLLLGTLPFLWVGLAMTFRRIVDAGLTAWLSLFYFVPLINYALFLLLCTLPTAPPRPAPSAPHTTRDQHFLQTSFLVLIGSLGIALVTTTLSVYVFKSYGTVMFIGTPVAIGAVDGYVLNRGTFRSFASTLAVVSVAMLLCGAAVLLFAIEGLLCIAMAAPLAVCGAALGAAVGRAIARLGPTPPHQLAGVVLAFPVLSGVGSSLHRSPPERHEVVSAVEINAPPAVVWANVIGFSEMPPPGELVFRSGIAYPIRAHIEGLGVGAVRHCEFSTGPFIEPITRFDPASRLSFDVTAQPLPLRELTPYALHPPHLDAYFRSVAGEFRLTPLHGGRTRLEGSTWYELDITPTAYWTAWASWLIHAIHLRVLGHVQALSEGRAPLS